MCYVNHIVRRRCDQPDVFCRTRFNIERLCTIRVIEGEFSMLDLNWLNVLPSARIKVVFAGKTYANTAIHVNHFLRRVHSDDIIIGTQVLRAAKYA